MGVAAELLAYRVPEGRDRRLFFCQREAIETIVFLVEASLRLTRAVDALGMPRIRDVWMVRCVTIPPCGPGKTTGAPV